MAREKCRAASLGAVGHALAAALALEAEASAALGDGTRAVELLRRLRRHEEQLHGSSADGCALDRSGMFWADGWDMLG